MAKKKKKKVAKSKKNGRPTKYRKAYCDKLIKFFDVEPYIDVDIHHYEKSGRLDKNGNRVVIWDDIRRLPNKLPTLVGFAREIGICYATLFNWMDKEHGSFHQGFLDTVTRIAKALQKDHLIQCGLQGLYNPQAFKFVAINCTDMEDKSSQELTGQDGKPIQVNIVDFRGIDDTK